MGRRGRDLLCDATPRFFLQDIAHAIAIEKSDEMCTLI